MSVGLRQILLLMRDVPRGVRFYGAEGLGLPVLFASEEYAKLALSPNPEAPVLTLQAVEREADCSTGYSPLLHFDVQDMDETVTRLLMQGGRLDGPIKYPIEGKVASVRTPDGHMVGLFEPNSDLKE